MKGFTLIELLIVVAIIAIAIGAGVSFYTGGYQETQIMECQ